MNELQVTAILKIHEGKLEDFKKIAHQCIQIVKEKDTGTLRYDWFINDDGSECHVREVYRDSNAILEHMTNLGDTFGAMLSISDITVLIYGNPSDTLLEATKDIPSVTYHPL